MPPHPPLLLRLPLHRLLLRVPQQQAHLSVQQLLPQVLLLALASFFLLSFLRASTVRSVNEAARIPCIQGQLRDDYRVFPRVAFARLAVSELHS